MAIGSDRMPSCRDAPWRGWRCTSPRASRGSSRSKVCPESGDSSHSPS